MVLCGDCATDHKQWKPFEGHNIIEMNKLILASVQKNGEICSQHGKPLALYCLNCELCICQECGDEIVHNNHTVQLLAEFMKENVQSDLDRTKEQLDQLQATLEELEKRREEVLMQGEETKRKIQMQAQGLISKLMESERQIVDQIDNNVQRKVRTLEGQEEDAKSILQELKHCQQYVELSLQLGTPESVLLEKDALMRHIEKVTKKAQEKDFTPLEKPDITITRN